MVGAAGLKEGCIILLWMFIVYTRMDGVMKDILDRVVDMGISLMREGKVWKVQVLLFADDIVSLSEDKWKLHISMN